MRIYERFYDNPLDENGKKKPNKFLGDFKIVKTLFLDSYDSKRIGVKDGKKYLIEEFEISFTDGGSCFTVTAIE